MKSILVGWKCDVLSRVYSIIVAGKEGKKDELDASECSNIDEERNVNAKASKECRRRYCDVLEKEREEERWRAKIYISSSCFSITLVRRTLFSSLPLSFAPLSLNLARVLFSHL